MECQPRVNSRLLPQYIGRHILLMCEIINIENRNTNVLASDRGEVKIHLPPGETFETLVFFLSFFSLYSSYSFIFFLFFLTSF